VTQYQGFSPRFVAIGLLALILTGLTAWLLSIESRQLMGLLLVAWMVGLYVAAEIFERGTRQRRP
jgi:hypothetical protein